jgi:hypothetical protein
MMIFGWDEICFYMGIGYIRIYLWSTLVGDIVDYNIEAHVISLTFGTYMYTVESFSSWYAILSS